MKGREKWETSRRQHRPPPPTRWIPPRAERAFQACWVYGYLTFVWELWQIVAEEPGEARDAVPLLMLMTERLRYVEWPRDEDDLIHGTPMFERVAERAAREERGLGHRRPDVPRGTAPEHAVVGGDYRRGAAEASALK
jgi:hypothetical protein